MLKKSRNWDISRKVIEKINQISNQISGWNMWKIRLKSSHSPETVVQSQIKPSAWYWGFSRSLPTSQKVPNVLSLSQMKEKMSQSWFQWCFIGFIGFQTNISGLTQKQPRALILSQSVGQLAPDSSQRCFLVSLRNSFIRYEAVSDWGAGFVGENPVFELKISPALLK